MFIVSKLFKLNAIFWAKICVDKSIKKLPIQPSSIEYWYPSAHTSQPLGPPSRQWPLQALSHFAHSHESWFGVLL